MSDPIQDGGPAFPVQTEYITTYQDKHGDPIATSTRPTGFHGGMTLRDWFAGQALQGVLAGRIYEMEWDESDSALVAYQFADAMLSAREPKQL